MKKACWLYRAITVFLLIGVCLPAATWAQDSRRDSGSDLMDIKKVENPKKVKSPNYKLDVQPADLAKGKEREWIMLEVEYETKPEWLDEVTVTYNLLFKNPDGPPKYLVFQGSITYVNVAEGKHMSVAFLAPSTIARYGQPGKVAVEITSSYKGRPIRTTSERMEKWQQFPPRNSYVLNRFQTPFAPLSFSGFEMIKWSGQ